MASDAGGLTSIAIGLKGFSTRLGVYAQTETILDSENKYKIPGYHTYDAKIGYLHDSYEISFVVKNLTDRNYYERLDYFAGRITAGLERIYLVNFTYNF